MSFLKLTLFGAPQVELNGLHVTLKTRKAFAVLAYLAVSCQPHSRETLATLFWPDFSSERAFANLRGVLQSLTQPLGGDWFDICRRDVEIRPSSAFWVDVLEFQRLVDHQNSHHSPALPCAATLPSLHAAVDLYRDEFLHGFTLPDCLAFDEWQAIHTDQLREQMLDALRQLVHYYATQHDFTSAIHYAQRRIAVCPWDEDAHRDLMRIYFADRQRSAALQQYQECAHILREEFETEPEPDTQALYRAMLNHQYSDSESQLGHHVPDDTSAPVSPPHNLPAQTTTFIGREAEVAAVIGLLSQADVRLVTLTGPGGAGKTRLGLRAAERLLNHFADGVWLISFAPITNPDFVVPTIAQALGLQIIGNVPPLEVITTYLHQKRLLLLIDNFEHLLDAALVLSELLAAVPGLKIFATSRTVLRLSGEYDYLVPPLRLPDPANLPSFEDLMRFEAIRLFAERAYAVDMNFRLTEENAPIVAQICACLDGLPLAIELAAARARLLSPQAMLAHLECPLRFLSWGVRDLPLRQQTLRNTITWSYHLLDAAEQTIFRRLAVFVGGCTLEAAEAVCQIAYDVEVFDGLQTLVDHHLITQAEVNGEPRFTILETIREYALERLVESGEEETIRQQHTQFFLALAEKAEPCWDTVTQTTWLVRLDAENNNLRGALAWSIDHSIETCLQLAGALGRFWDIRAYDHEGLHWLTNVLEKSRVLGDGIRHWRARAFSYAGLLAWLQGDHNSSRSFGEDGLILWQSLCDAHWTAYALQILGLNELSLGERQKARTYLEESIALYRRQEDKHGLSDALWKYGYLLSREHDYEHAQVSTEEGFHLAQEVGNVLVVAFAPIILADIAMYQGDYPAAHRLYEKGLERSRKIENSNGIAHLLTAFAALLDIQGDYNRAKTCYTEALDIDQKRGNYFGVAWQRIGLGRVALHQGDWHTARSHFAESLTLFRKREERLGFAAYLIGMAGIAHLQGHLEQVVQLLGSVTDLLPDMSKIFYKEDIAIRFEYDRLAAEACHSFGEEAFAAAIAKGRAMTLEQAIELALADAQANSPT